VDKLFHSSSHGLLFVLQYEVCVLSISVARVV